MSTATTGLSAAAGVKKGSRSRSETGKTDSSTSPETSSSGEKATKKNRVRIFVDEGILTHPAVQALDPNKYEVEAFVEDPPDLFLSERAAFFSNDWWDDPKLVEAALKRIRVLKKGRKK